MVERRTGIGSLLNTELLGRGKKPPACPLYIPRQHFLFDSDIRHQILIKATHLGLKESTTRMGKRKRESDGTTPSDIALPAAPSSTVGTAAQNQAREGTVSQSASPAVPHTEVPSASNIPQHSRYPAQLTWKSTSVPFTSTTSGTITSRTTTGTSRTSGSTTFRQYYPPNT